MTIGGDGVVGPALPLVKIPQGVVKLRRGLGGDGAGKTGGRIVRRTHFGERQAESVMALGLVGLDRQRAAKQVDSLSVMAGLVSDQAQQMKRVRLVRLDSKDLTIETGGFGQASGAVFVDRLLQDLILAVRHATSMASAVGIARGPAVR